MGYVIDKQFNFAYGHRVWSQKLNKEYASDDKLVCRHLHGHEGQVHVHLTPINFENKLVDGMVTDFKHLGWFKEFIDDNIDHKFIMDVNDPLFEHEVLTPLFSVQRDNILYSEFVKYALIENSWGFKVVNKTYYENLPEYLIEKYEGMVFVDFVPTSENLCFWLNQIVNKKMNPLGVKCSKLEFRETPKSRATYTL